MLDLPDGGAHEILARLKAEDAIAPQVVGGRVNGDISTKPPASVDIAHLRRA